MLFRISKGAVTALRARLPHLLLNRPAVTPRITGLFRRWNRDFHFSFSPPCNGAKYSGLSHFYDGDVRYSPQFGPLGGGARRRPSKGCLSRVWGRCLCLFFWPKKIKFTLHSSAAEQILFQAKHEKNGHDYVNEGVP